MRLFIKALKVTGLFIFLASLVFITTYYEKEVWYEYFILFFILGMYVRYETRIDKLSEDLRMLEMHCGCEADDEFRRKF